MNNLMVFNNKEFGEVRTVEIEGKIYFVGKDVASALGYSNSSKAVSTHCKHIRKEVIDVSSQNGNAHKSRKTQEMSLIDEGDVYRLIIKSKLESAERFESWVFDEVLPTIRKTGGYIPVNDNMSDSEIMAKALMIAQKTIENKDKLIEELQPKGYWFDKFINSEGTFTATQVAKLFGLSSAKKLNKLLNDMKIIYKQGKNWLPYADIDTEWFKLIVGSSNEHSYSQLKFTPVGVMELSNKLDIELSENDLKEVI